jgi:hypothetical protein
MLNGKRIVVVAETRRMIYLRNHGGRISGFIIEALPQNTDPDALLKA